MVTKEIERLRSSIQLVCRSSLPLGKIMDYIQEDMDAMQAELLSWRRENKEHAQALLQEQRFGHRIINTLFNLCAVSNTRSHTHTHICDSSYTLFILLQSKKRKTTISTSQAAKSSSAFMHTIIVSLLCVCVLQSDRSGSGAS